MPDLSFGAQFIELFAQMSVVTYICLLTGLMLIIVEFFQPSRGIFGYSGLTLLILGIVVRMIGRGTVAMLFMMVFFSVAVILIAHTVMLWRHKREWLTHSLALAITDTDIKQLTNYSFLLNREGIASTDIDKKGHMTINEINFYVSSANFIPKGTRVRVTDVRGDKIQVSAVYEDSESPDGDF